jgi:predicted ATPase
MDSTRLRHTMPGRLLVELTALSDPQLVPRAVAQAHKVNDPPPRPVVETFNDYLGSKRLLLVLEGCVHLVDLILRRSPHVAMLVTSLWRAHSRDYTSRCVWPLRSADIFSIARAQRPERER